MLANYDSIGLDSKRQYDIDLRERLYGINKIEFKSSKSFLKLVWDALQDKTLIMLEVSAILSLALSFYDFPQDEQLDEGSFAKVSLFRLYVFFSYL